MNKKDKKSLKIKDSDRVIVNYERVIKRANKLGLSLSQISRAIGRSPGFISAMYSGSSKMLYCDLKQIARVTNVHGATKLIAEEECANIDKDVLADMKADAPTDERIAAALEAITNSLRTITENREDNETTREKMGREVTKIGRPRNEKLIREKGPQKGLTEGWTRATFIVETDALETLKDYAYTERLTMKEVVQMAFDQFLEGIDINSLLHEQQNENTEEL